MNLQYAYSWQITKNPVVKFREIPQKLWEELISEGEYILPRTDGYRHDIIPLRPAGGIKTFAKLHEILPKIVRKVDFRRQANLDEIAKVQVC